MTESYCGQIHFYTEKRSLVGALERLACGESAVVALDQGLEKIWRQKLAGLAIDPEQIFLLPQGEKAKTWETVQCLTNFLLEKNHERTAPLIAIGGGAACDAAALVASLYRRGIPLYLVPTTLVAMIDAAIGGKTAINIQSERKILKNALGSFYPAKEVWCWPEWIESLPHRERLSGMGELCKSLWLQGQQPDLPSWSAWLKGTLLSDTQREQMVRAAHSKARIVEQDPLDLKGVRAALNYGHTLGHAFESIASLQKKETSHGEAIAWGMWVESAFLEGKPPFLEKITQTLHALKFPIPHYLKKTTPGQIATFLQADKKSKGGRIEMLALRDFGCPKKAAVKPYKLAAFAATFINTALLKIEKECLGSTLPPATQIKLLL